MNKRFLITTLALSIITSTLAPAREYDKDTKLKLQPARATAKTHFVDQATMESVYHEVKTPFKYGVVLKGAGGTKVDCPAVFRHENRWYMTYIVFDGTGYETYLAQSTDLIDWSPRGKILGRRQGNWDSSQTGGYATLQDPKWGGSYQLLRHDGKYWLSYIGGVEQGYEKGKLGIGLAWTKTPG